MRRRTSRGWELPERAALSASRYFGRRALLQSLGFAGTAALLEGCYLSVDGDEGGAEALQDCSDYAAAPERNPRYVVPERCLTPELRSTRFNNFYEFTSNKAAVWQLVDGFETSPWAVEVSGLVANPGVFDLDRLAALSEVEERVYRFRCVEAWAMTVPWRGLPFSALARLVEPSAEARFVRFHTANRPDQMPGVRGRPEHPWPYREGLTIDEAMNELCFLATGLYGKPLPAQNGAPVRLLTPWKYGYKSIKSIERIEFVAEQPATFWNSLWPEAYDFNSNVDPGKAHPRWSQASETLIESGEVVPTRLYNGYAEFVAHLYG